MNIVALDKYHRVHYHGISTVSRRFFEMYLYKNMDELIEQISEFYVGTVSYRIDFKFDSYTNGTDCTIQLLFGPSFSFKFTETDTTLERSYSKVIAKIRETLITDKDELTSIQNFSEAM